MAQDKTILRIVMDQCGAPTYAPHLAKASIASLQLVQNHSVDHPSAPSGVYHLCNSGVTQRHAFAEFIVQEAKEYSLC